MSDNLQKYQTTINGIYRQTKDELWTTEFATLVLLLGAVLFTTILVNVVFFSFGGWLIGFLIYFAEIIVPLVVLYRHQQKVYEAVREKVSEMDAANPGIFKAYEEWRRKAEES